jgi:hypothetical protein
MSTDERRSPTPEDVPAGGAGADTGSVDAAQVDPTDRAEIPNVSSQNDIPGVGTRGGDGYGVSEQPAQGGREESAEGGSLEGEFDTADGDAGSSGETTIEDLQPGVDPESARTSRAVRSGDLPDL